MAHEINKTDAFGEVREHGKRAWHGLGVEIEDGLSAQDGFKHIGLGWPTILAPVHAHIPIIEENAEGEPEMGTQVVEIPERRAHFRADTMELLGVVSNQYRPLENMDLARFADALVDAGDGKVIVETAGSLHSGRRVFACVKLPEQVRATDYDVMDQYVLVSNGHGGTASFSCYPTSVRVVCANTLRWSEKDVSRGLRFFHLGSMEDKLANARVTLGTAMKENELFQEQVTALVGLDLDSKTMRELATEIYYSSFGKIATGIEEKSRENLERKRDEVIAKWMENMEDDRQRIAGIEGSGWAFYNAISQWHDHERGRFGGVEESNARVSSNIFGVSQEHKSKAFRRILAAV